MVPSVPTDSCRVAFVGGGNMACAILGGLIAAGHPRDRLSVVEPHAPQAATVREKFGIKVDATCGVERQKGLQVSS